MRKGSDDGSWLKKVWKEMRDERAGQINTSDKSVGTEESYAICRMKKKTNSMGLIFS